VGWFNNYLSEGLRPSDSPAGALTRRCAGSFRSPGSLAMLARATTPAFAPRTLPYSRPHSPLRRLVPVAWLARAAVSSLAETATESVIGLCRISAPQPIESP